MTATRCILRVAVVLWVATSVAGAEPVLRMARPQVIVRSDAAPQSAKVTTLRQGEETELLRRKGEWLQIRTADGRTGWVHEGLVQERLVVSGTDELNIRSGAGAQFPILAKIYQGDEFGKLRQQGNWLQVETDDGQTGWVMGRYAKPRTQLAPAARRPAVPPEAEAAPPPTTDAPVRRNPYAEGLVQETEGNYRGALASFALALEQDSSNVTVLLHAGLAHKELGEYDQALSRLYQVQEKSPGRREALKALAEVYELKAIPDSARKYQTLFRGDEAAAEEKPTSAPAPAPAPPPEPVSWRQDLLLYLGVVAGSSLVILLFLLGVRILWRRLRRGRGGASGTAAPALTEEPPPRGKFARMVRDSQGRPGGAGRPPEEVELDRRIEEKWQELRASAAAFIDPDRLDQAGPGELEAAHTDQLLGHLETLRRTMEAQEQRARQYAEIVRLQNLKIEAMGEEIRLLRRQRRRE